MLTDSDADSNATHEYGTNPLHNAIENNDIGLIEFLLNHGANVNASTDKGIPLCLAIKKEHKKVVKILLDKGADINAKDRYGLSPLHSAIATGDIELVELLLNYGRNATNDEGTPQWLAIEKAVKSLLDKGAAINVRDRYGRTPLQYAVINGVVKLVELFSDHKANVNASNDDGITPLHIEAKNELAIIARHLVNHGANVYPRTDNGFLLWVAIRKGKNVVVQILLDKLNGAGVYGTTPLHYAVINGDIQLVEFLINRGANVNASNDDSITPLHIAILKKHKEIVEILLKYGANCDSTSKSIITTLNIAVLGEWCSEDIVDSILEFGADVDSRDEYGKTALHIACKEDSSVLVCALLQHGSDINIIDKDNNTPLDIANAVFLSRIYISCTEGYSSDCDYGFLCGHDLLARMIQHHIVMMKTANLYVSEKNLQSIRNFSIDSEWGRRFLQDCEKEVAIMKSEKTSNTNISFYDILTKDTNLLAIFLRNEDIVELLRSDVCRNGPCKTRFPLYASMIESHFRKGMKRKELLEQGTEMFFNNFYVLPHECIERILKYLSNNDLRILMDAFKAC